ncbi:CDP-diacylglycerol--glycerol-3-phosphate 3-phosphatidyltransferase [Nesterenkonia natronophila]|uniref:CDP-diacylglycerol--glycerol-3-phosphate 3-phosphatidyltransferase n=1 Tax=Nesterenkonia natronophila TaxID=2174932 RepID=A0A3A4F5J7_9MICC|nr:CDP-diacylglycerol--glycerol-3-phosphate 3-phosphatidyltransferase [Nesterenkonia natronophila]RJN33016.1 CDP-diacylglycerol--glycerol-3-phosphate 3-phosphatidyltransferase [Nesterenkonia natronophila]
MNANAKAPLLNIANVLTMVRIVLVPVLIILLVVDAEPSGAGVLQPLESGDGILRWAAAGVFAVAMATDVIDGDLARKRNLITDFGKIADPIADKLLIGAALVMLSLLGELPWWVTALILIRELGITALRLMMLRTQVMPASRGGKLKTLLQTAGLQLMLLPLAVIAGWLAEVSFWIMMAALVVTVITGIDYLLQAMRIRRAARGGS